MSPNEEASLALQRQTVELLRSIRSTLSTLFWVVLVIMIALGVIVEHSHWVQP
jgi:hypothetical protein